MRTCMRQRGQAGFSYIDVMIAMVILMVGILTMAAALTAALVKTTAGEAQLRAKAIASSVLENVMSARNVSIGTNPYSFDSIRDTANGGVFVVGRTPAYVNPGADGLFGTADDAGDVEDGFMREIIIQDVNDPERPTPPNPITERRITVNVYYYDRSMSRVETISTHVANY